MGSNIVQGRRHRAFGVTLTATLAAFVATIASQTASATVATAARNADVDEVRKMIAAGSDVNTLEADGTSALLWAAYQSSPELVTLLLDAGADPNAANNFGVTPLLQASRYRRCRNDESVAQGRSGYRGSHREGETPLTPRRARAGRCGQVLLERGADPNAVESLGRNGSDVGDSRRASRQSSARCSAAGADPNIKARVSELTKRSTRSDFSSGGFTALMWAVRDGNEPIVRRLFEGGADINATNGDGAIADDARDHQRSLRYRGESA